jgi:hypothetical protein
MGADILIHHCTLRFSRRHGWSWGPDAKALLRAALERLPAMLAARLAETWPEESDCEVVAPLRLRLPVRMEELLELASVSAGQSAGVTSVGLAQRVDTLLGELVQRAIPDVTPAARSPIPAPEEAAPDIALLWAGTVLAVLLGWHRQGNLHEQLLTFSQAALASWHASLQAGVVRSLTDAEHADRIAALASAHAALPLPLAAGQRASLIRRIGLMVDAAGQFGVPTGDPLILDAMQVHQQFQLPQVSGTEVPARVSMQAMPEQERGQTLSRPLATPVRAPLTSFDVKICSALPFLLLGPLARTGFLQTLGAVFEAAQMLPALPALAVALARKVLEPPQRGWFRSGQATLAAAAFAGRAEALPDNEVADMARLLAPQVSPLDGVVASVLTAGHSPGSVLVLQAAKPGWTLFEEEGMFPVAWAATVERLYARMAALGGEILLVPQQALEPGLLARLDDAGFRFITDAAPARGEAWRSVFAGALRGWTNVPTGVPPALTRLDHAGHASAQVWQALTAERPLQGGESVPELERSLALAAALALGTLGWSLWSERETVTPLLALERFADFDARVSFRPAQVTVHLPLGRRFMDLKGAGWLDDIAGVPWFDGRPLRFVQG